MAERYRVLLGMHDGISRMDLAENMKLLKCSVTQAGLLSQMLDHARDEEFDWHFMDSNLGNSMSDGVDPADQVYELIKERVGRGEARLVTFSFNWDSRSPPRRDYEIMGKSEFGRQYIEMIRAGI